MYGTPRAWLNALAAGPACFFSGVVKSAPLHVRRTSSVWHNLLVYWPMKAGVDLVHTRSLRTTAGKLWRRLKKGRAGWECPPSRPDARAGKGFYPSPLSPEIIRRMIREPGIKVVSFDIFDTLLLRPALHPKDIFYLIAARVDSIYNVDFVKMRWNAEEGTGKPNATIYDIYAYMRRKYSLEAATAEALLKEEIHCEAVLLAPREDLRVCYDEAVKLGKRVIAVSDMYLPADVLRSFLRENGYEHIAAIYVSCEYDRRKSDGALYDSVITAENVHSSEILHIGDNNQADCLAALTRRITAVHSPSPLTQCLDADPDFAVLVGTIARREPFWSLLLGFALHRFCAEGEGETTRIADVGKPRRFATLTMAPLLTGYCLSLAGDADLRNAYKQIHFASRDGYLPYKVYSVIGRYVTCLPGVYLYAGRRAYYPFLHDSFFDYASSLEPSGDSGYTLHDFIHAHFSSAEFLEILESDLTGEEKSLSFFAQRERCLRILGRYKEDIAAFMATKRAKIKKYYTSVFLSQEKRHLVFDLGYSGSISQALSTATGKAVDKLYFWATSANKKRDKAHGTRTRTFMRNRGYIPYNLLFEEAFSPCSGGVVDFDQDGLPVFEALPVSENFRADMAAMHEACLAFAEAFCTRFDAYLPYVRPASGDAVVDICRFLLSDNPFRNQRLFRNIVFPDPLHHASVSSLEYKVERFLTQKTVFSGTGFADPHHVFIPDPSFAAAPRTGMHLHLHNLALADEIVRYLRDFPAPLDLFITITDEAAAGSVRNLFSPICIPTVKSVRVLPMPNRGRDIAPWVLGMRPHQADYELFCHLHAKESPHFDFGDAWRRYLFDNLLQPSAVGDIFMLFRQRPRLGCLFPPVFPQLAAFMTVRDIPPAGLKGECRLAGELLRRMGLRDEICRSEIFFPVGNMLWYRPHALRQLFTFDLALEEFAAEPIGVEGTLAHALERLPALIAARNGYQAGTFARTA